MSNLYLAHHGRKDQRWGVRNGPPYPLDKAKVKIAYAKDKIRESKDRNVEYAKRSFTRTKNEIGNNLKGMIKPMSNEEYRKFKSKSEKTKYKNKNEKIKDKREFFNLSENQKRKLKQQHRDNNIKGKARAKAMQQISDSTANKLKNIDKIGAAMLLLPITPVGNAAAVAAMAIVHSQANKEINSLYIKELALMGYYSINGRIEKIK